MTPAELCAKYPYTLGANAWDYPWGSPERLRAVEPESLRMALAGWFLAAEGRWSSEEAKRAQRAATARQSRIQAQSREHVDHWEDR